MSSPRSTRAQHPVLTPRSRRPSSHLHSLDNPLTYTFLDGSSGKNPPSSLGFLSSTVFLSTSLTLVHVTDQTRRVEPLDSTDEVPLPSPPCVLVNAPIRPSSVSSLVSPSSAESSLSPRTEVLSGRRKGPLPGPMVDRTTKTPPSRHQDQELVRTIQTGSPVVLGGVYPHKTSLRPSQSFVSFENPDLGRPPPVPTTCPAPHPPWKT